MASPVANHVVSILPLATKTYDMETPGNSVPADLSRVLEFRDTTDREAFRRQAALDPFSLLRAVEIPFCNVMYWPEAYALPCLQAAVKVVKKPSE